MDYTEKRSFILKQLDSPISNNLFNSLCSILDSRGELTDVTIQIASNIAYNEFIISELQLDIALRGVVETIESGLISKSQPNKSIDQMRAMTTSTSKLYNDLKILPREVKERAAEDLLDAWIR